MGIKYTHTIAYKQGGCTMRVVFDAVAFFLCVTISTVLIGVVSFIFFLVAP